MANAQESLSYKKYTPVNVRDRVPPKGKTGFSFWCLFLAAVPWARNRTHAQSKAEESVLPVLPAPAPSQNLKEKTKTKTKALLFWAGPDVAMDPKQTPAALLTLGCPSEREQRFWNDWLATKWIHGIWCGIKIIEHDTHKIQIRHHHWPHWGPPGLRVFQISQWVLSTLLDPRMLAQKEISVLFFALLCLPSVPGVHLTGPGSVVVVVANLTWGYCFH